MSLVIYFIILVVGLIGSAIIVNLVMLRNDIRNQSFTLYQISKDLKEHISLILDTRNDVSTSSDELKEELNVIDKHLISLIMGVVKKKKEKRYPRADEISQIERSIKDLIDMEVLLTKEQEYATPESNARIANHVSNIYPDIDEEYISRKVLSSISVWNDALSNKTK